MSEFRKITGHVYSVENQNGFNNALYDYFSATDDGKNNTHSKKQVREMVQNFPKIYPTTIVIIDQTFECGRVYIEYFDLDYEAHFTTIKIKNMIDKIQEIYERINNEFLFMISFGSMNAKNYRAKFKELLEKEIVNSVIKCDEENNPPNVIDFCCLVAKVTWTENHQQKYCDLIFGRPENVIRLQRDFW